MPDGDRFQWMLKGKGWRKLKKLITAGAGDELVASQALSAVTEYLKVNPDFDWRELVGSVHCALSTPVMLAVSPDHGIQGVTALSIELERLAEKSDFSEATLLGNRAALRVFLNLDSSEKPPSRSDVAEALVGELTTEIVERRCLAFTRDDIASKCGRNFEEEMIYEKQLKAAIKRAAIPLAKTLNQASSLLSIRAPRRPKQDAPALDTPLPILPE